MAFFLGIMQPATVRARRHGDLRVVVLSREGREALFRRHPDQLEVVSRNLLRRYGLDLDGSPLSAGGAGGAGAGEEDAGRAAVREELRAGIVRRREEAFAAAVLATRAGEADAVRRVAFGGIEAARDHDGHTLLAHAAAAGAYKVAELLLELRAEVNARDRWGQTALDEALAARQQAVVQLLVQRRAAMGSEAMTAALVDAASSGRLEAAPDAEQLAGIMRQSGVDADAADYDRRTALHLACANGHRKTAELLLGLKADINAEDRWGGTPLADAVVGGHVELAGLLRRGGARMSREAGPAMFFDAAARGSVVTLRLLHGCGIVELE